MPKIKMIESAPKGRTFHLTTMGDKIGGFGSGNIFRLANKSDIPLYLLSGDPKGSYEMLKVTGTKVADAKKADGYDPADVGDGYVLVADGDIKPWPVNWLTVDDEERVYINIADLSKAVEFLTNGRT